MSRLSVKLTKVPLLCLRGKTFHSFTLPQERIKELYPLLIASILNANINFANVRTQKLRGSGNPPRFKSDKIEITFSTNLQITNYGSAIFRKIRTVHIFREVEKFYTIPTSMINTVKPPSATNSRKRQPPISYHLFNTLKFSHSKPYNQIRTTRKTTTSHKRPRPLFALMFV